MSAEQRTITVTAYRDRVGNPTCAANFESGAVCMFYATQSFGTAETCLLADKRGRRWQPIERRNEGRGSLIPIDKCPVWPAATAEG